MPDSPLPNVRPCSYISPTCQLDWIWNEFPMLDRIVDILRDDAAPKGEEDSAKLSH